MRFRPAFFLFALLAAPAFAASAPDPSEVKIRLLADALTARDRGDYAAAKSKLEALQAMAPNDPTVRRILADIVARQNAPPAPPPPPRPVPPPPGPVIESVPVPASAPAPVAGNKPAPAAPGQVVMPVVHVEKSDAPEIGPADTRSPEARRAAAAAEALLHANDAPLGRVMSYVEAQRALAQTQARDRDYAAAIATLEAALEELQRPVNELRAERRAYAAQKRELEREEERARTGVRIRRKQ